MNEGKESMSVQVGGFCGLGHVYCHLNPAEDAWHHSVAGAQAITKHANVKRNINENNADASAYADSTHRRLSFIC